MAKGLNSVGAWLIRTMESGAPSVEPLGQGDFSRYLAGDLQALIWGLRGKRVLLGASLEVELVRQVASSG